MIFWTIIIALVASLLGVAMLAYLIRLAEKLDEKFGQRRTEDEDE